MLRANSRRKLERSVGIEIHAPTGGRPYRARHVEPHQAVEEARAHAEAGERFREREMIARARATDVRKEHEPGRRPAIRDLEPPAPKRVTGRRVAAVPTQRSGPP